MARAGSVLLEDSLGSEVNTTGAEKMLMVEELKLEAAFAENAS
jgi:hypothetical protein